MSIEQKPAKYQENNSGTPCFIWYKKATNTKQARNELTFAQSVVNRAALRKYHPKSIAIIHDERYLTAAQAFAEQLKRFNNVLEAIQKAGQ